MNNLSIIVAITKDFAIGRNNDLLMFIPGDLKRFKEITTGFPVIMGRNTLLSLPRWPLPNRRNIVITDNRDENFEGCEMVYSIQEAINLVQGEKEAFVMGGGMIYKQFYPIADKLYLTLVDRSYEADTFFPTINCDEWDETAREDFAPAENADCAARRAAPEKSA